jgi:hypothetical protein
MVGEERRFGKLGLKISEVGGSCSEKMGGVR